MSPPENVVRKNSHRGPSLGYRLQWRHLEHGAGQPGHFGGAAVLDVRAKLLRERLEEEFVDLR